MLTPPRSPSDEIKTFSIWINGKKMCFDALPLKKLSPKVSQLIEEGKTKYVISKRVSRSARLEFCNACHRKPFAVKISYAFDLLYLADEMNVVSLQKFVYHYINEKGISPTDDIEFSEEEKEEEEEESISDKEMSGVTSHKEIQSKTDQLKQIQELTKENEELKIEKRKQNRLQFFYVLKNMIINSVF